MYIKVSQYKGTSISHISKQILHFSSNFDVIMALRAGLG